MANRARGEAALVLGDKEYPVTLGLGALAELEDAFGVDDFEKALDFSRISGKRLEKFVIAVLRGNDIDVEAEGIKARIRRMTVPKFMAFVTDLMAASGLSEQAADAAGDSSAPLAGQTGGASG